MSVGFHIYKNKRTMAVAMEEGLAAVKALNMNPCAQIFVSGPQSYEETLSAADKAALKPICGQFDIVIHGAYVDNPWSGNDRSCQNIIREMTIAHEIGAKGVVVHLSRAAAVDANLTKVFDTLRPALLPLNAELIIEINAAKPSAESYETPQKVARLFHRLRTAAGPDMRLCFCVDTAHLYSCGLSMATRETATEWLAAVDAAAKEHDFTMMIHLNDSQGNLGSGLDRHEHLCMGAIWSAYHPATGALPIAESGLAAFLDYAQRENIPCVIESQFSAGDLKIVADLGFFTAQI